jgi:hypothetical protein
MRCIKSGKIGNKTVRKKLSDCFINGRINYYKEKGLNHLCRIEIPKFLYKSKEYRPGYYGRPFKRWQGNEEQKMEVLHPVTGFCEHGHEPLGVIKAENFLTSNATCNVCRRTLHCGVSYLRRQLHFNNNEYACAISRHVNLTC